MNGERPREQSDPGQPSEELEIPETPEESKMKEEKFEKELSPEAIEKIMEKVQDINKDGMAVHSVFRLGGLNNEENRKTVSDILKNGILGQDWDKPSSERETISKNNWAKAARHKKRLFVFFNIVDKDLNVGEKYRSKPEWAKGDIAKIEESPWLKNPNSIGIIFDTNTLKGRIYAQNRSEPKKLKSRYYDPWESQGTPSEEGYTVTPRVKPNLFKGLVFRTSRPATQEESKYMQRVDQEAHFWRINYQWTDERYAFVESNDDEIKTKRAEEIAQIMIRNMNEKYLVPIYDVYGNLFWPEQMSYEEVKQFVEERIEKEQKAKEQKPEKEIKKESKKETKPRRKKKK